MDPRHFKEVHNCVSAKNKPLALPLAQFEALALKPSLEVFPSLFKKIPYLHEGYSCQHFKSISSNTSKENRSSSFLEIFALLNKKIKVASWLT